MALCTKETFTTTNGKAWASILVRMANTTKVSGTRTRGMAKVRGALMVKLTKVSGTKMNSKDD